MLAFVHNLDMHWSVYTALAVMVWLIYTFDHLMDAKSIGANVTSDRHRFHQQYFKQIIYYWSVLLIASAFVLLPHLPHRTILFGVLGSVFVIVHFVFVKLLGSKLSVWIQKEFGVALVFTLGVFIGPLSYLKSFDDALLLDFIRLFLVAFFNLIMYSLFDLGIDRAQNQTSLTRYLGEKNTRFFLIGLDSLFLLTCVFNQFNSSFFFFFFVLLFYNGMVFLKLGGKTQQYFRLVGDSILIGAVLVPFI